MVGIEGTAGSVTGITHRAEVTEDNKIAVYATGSNSGPVDISGNVHLYGSGIIGPAEVNTATHDVVTITQEHHQIHEGLSFMNFASGAGGNGAEINLMLTTQNSDKWAHIIHRATSSVEANFKIWEAGTYSGATAITPTNRNRNAGINAVTTLKENVVISGTSATSGTKILEEHFGAGRTGGESRAMQEEWILKSGTDYLFVLKSEAASADLNLELNWYELTSKTTQF